MFVFIESFAAYRAKRMQILQKRQGNLFFEVCHIIKVPLNGLTYNPAKYLHFSSPFQGSEKYVRNS
jgi:hypothetical protein